VCERWRPLRGPLSFCALGAASAAPSPAGLKDRSDPKRRPTRFHSPRDSLHRARLRDFIETMLANDVISEADDPIVHEGSVYVRAGPRTEGATRPAWSKEANGLGRGRTTSRQHDGGHRATNSNWLKAPFNGAQASGVAAFSRLDWLARDAHRTRIIGTARRRYQRAQPAALTRESTK
jgi:hypothetical protein